jgi:hypothetical protein
MLLLALLLVSSGAFAESKSLSPAEASEAVKSSRPKAPRKPLSVKTKPKSLSTRETIKQSKAQVSDDGAAGGSVVQRSATANLVSVDCPAGKTLITGGCRGVGGDGILASNPSGNSWICQFEPREAPLEKTAYAICRDRPAGYQTVSSSARANLAHTDCPSGKTLIGGGCRGVGGDPLIASNPTGNSWVCQFRPREVPLEKSAFAICAERPAGYQTVTNSAAANLAHAECPGSKTLIGGGCRGVGGDPLIATHPTGNTWVCQFKPRERPLRKTAQVTCGD